MNIIRIKTSCRLNAVVEPSAYKVQRCENKWISQQKMSCVTSVRRLTSSRAECVCISCPVSERKNEKGIYHKALLCTTKNNPTWSSQSDQRRQAAFTHGFTHSHMRMYTTMRMYTPSSGHEGGMLLHLLPLGLQRQLVAVKLTRVHEIDSPRCNNWFQVFLWGCGGKHVYSLSKIILWGEWIKRRIIIQGQFSWGLLGMTGQVKRQKSSDQKYTVHFLAWGTMVFQNIPRLAG